jgi:hypothetical protein
MFPELGYNVRAFACSSRAMRCASRTCHLQTFFAQVRLFHKEPRQESLPCYSLDDLEKGIDAEQIERLFVPMFKPVSNGFANIVRICLEKRVKLKVISRESEELLRFSRVKDFAEISVHSPPKLLTNQLKAQVKRVFDVFGSFFLVVLFSPLVALTTVANLIEDGRPVVFHQCRASMKGGKTFEFLKFRSMIKGTETKQKAMNGLNQTEGGCFCIGRTRD